MAERKEQIHRLRDGSEILIKRSGNHQYTFGDNTQKFTSTTGLAKHIDADSGGLIQWAVDESFARNDRLGHRASASESAEKGTKLHEAVERFIIKNDASEIDEVFALWLKQVGNHHKWASAEVMVINPETGSGGTCDALSFGSGNQVIAWDWKTKRREQSYLNSIPIFKDHAQIANYVRAFANMSSEYNVDQQTAKIAYLCLDTKKVYVEDVDITNAYELFKQSASLYRSKNAYKKGVSIDSKDSP